MSDTHAIRMEILVDGKVLHALEFGFSTSAGVSDLTRIRKFLNTAAGTCANIDTTDVIAMVDFQKNGT